MQRNIEREGSAVEDEILMGEAKKLNTMTRMMTKMSYEAAWPSMMRDKVQSAKSLVMLGQAAKYDIFVIIQVIVFIF